MKLFSLLIGINDYKNPKISNLNGCLNDIENITSFLTKNFSSTDLEITTLLNDEATYQNIIDSFRNNITKKAQKGDTVLFYYSGHGSRQVSAPEFGQFFSETFDETIVCHDSRTDETPDLADKEIAVLINDVAKKETKVIFILDSCHSGSATRDSFAKKENIVYRQATDNFTPRKLETYIDGYYSELVKTNKFNIPRSKHILFSACDKRELAKETENQTGLFSQTLLEVINTNKHLSYSELFVNVRKQILKYDIDQCPQLEAYEGFDPNTEFLTGLPIENQKYHEVFYNPTIQKWQVDIGALNKLSTNPEKPSNFEIFEYNENKFELKATVNSLEVLIDKTYLNMPKLQFNTNNQYFAKSLSIPEIPFYIKISAEKEIINLFNSSTPKELNFNFDEEIENSKYHIIAKNGEIELFTNYPKTKLVRKVTGYDKNRCINHIIEILIKIKNWERAIEIHNPYTEITSSDFELNIYDNNNQKIAFDGEKFESIFNGDPLKLILKAKNKSTNELNFNLIYFSDSFGIHSLTNNITSLPKTEEITLWGTNENDFFFLPETKTESIDIFKLFVSNKPIDTFAVTQSPIEDIGKTINLNTKDIGSFSIKKPLKTDDWTIKTLEIFLHK